MSRRKKRWLVLFETILLRAFSSFLCGLAESVNGWCSVCWLCWLTGTWRQKSLASRGRDGGVCWKTLQTPETLWKSRKTRSRILICLFSCCLVSLSSVSPLPFFILIQMGRNRWKFGIGAPFWITAFPPSMPSVLLSHLLLCHSRCSLENHQQWMAELNSSFLGSTSSNRFFFPLKNLSPNLISSLAIKLAIKIANNSVSGFTVHCATPGRTGFAFPKIFKCHSQRSWKRPLPVTFYCVSVCGIRAHKHTYISKLRFSPCKY